MSFIELKNVSFDYPNGNRAIEDVSLSVNKGETVAVIGQNGAGKTTAVKLINGLIKPTVGEVIVDGWNTKEHTTAQISRKVGYVFQNPDDQLFLNEVYSEVIFGPKNLGFSKEKTEECVRRAIELTDLKKILYENPYDLPYSIRKFVTIASVIAMDTDVIILDEPTAGQDIAGMRKLSYLIKFLQKSNKTIITITHDMEFVVNNFDRTVIMAHKNILYDGDKREAFWDEKLLTESKLKQPYISRLSGSLSIPGNILSVNEMIDFLESTFDGCNEIQAMRR